MDIKELNIALSKAKKQLEAAGNDDEKKFAQKKIDKLEAEIASLMRSQAVEKALEIKDESGKVIKSAKKVLAEHFKNKKQNKPAKSSKKEMITFKGVEYVKDSKEYCDAVKKDVDERKKKLAERKPSHKSISEKVSGHVASGVIGAITNVDHKKIEANPKKYIAKFTHVHKETEKYLAKLKDILGSDYSTADMKRPLSAINASIERIKSKYKPKK
jgi:hypothetical protein